MVAGAGIPRTALIISSLIRPFLLNRRPTFFRVSCFVQCFGTHSPSCARKKVLSSTIAGNAWLLLDPKLRFDWNKRPSQALGMSVPDVTAHVLWIPHNVVNRLVYPRPTTMRDTLPI